jgi:predicted GNAT family N-acyltransferase
LEYRIEPLGKHHDRARFSCGQPDLDEWFQQRASQDEKRNLARVFVAVASDLSVAGFYSLSSLSLTLESLPESLAKKLPRYNAIPAALIGRLARDERVRGKGVGEFLLVNAIQRILGAGQSIAVFAIVVDAKDEGATAFYKSFGFQEFPLQPRRLFLPSSIAAVGLQEASS